MVHSLTKVLKCSIVLYSSITVLENTPQKKEDSPVQAACPSVITPRWCAANPNIRDALSNKPHLGCILALMRRVLGTLLQ